MRALTHTHTGFYKHVDGLESVSRVHIVYRHARARYPSRQDPLAAAVSLRMMRKSDVSACVCMWCASVHVMYFECDADRTDFNP